MKQHFLRVKNNENYLTELSYNSIPVDTFNNELRIKLSNITSIMWETDKNNQLIDLTISFIKGD